MSDGNFYLGNPNLKKVNTPVEFTKNKLLNIKSVQMILFTLWKTMFVLYHLMKV
jgi:hypothetical protein